ncbi:MAG: choice-of-anchor J domain-containing protein [Candidatus Syntrophosphaera sp.]|nr:choice-of-anchor J domain-containing protein [Candidatus Syntrophosphaera sp.]
MKKITFLVFALLFSAALATAQDIVGYVFATSTAGSFQDMSTGTTVISPAGLYLDDYVSPVSNIGFTFVYAGTDYTQFSANSNGQMRLGPSSVSQFAFPAFNQALLHPLFGDLALHSNGRLHYKVFGSAPDRVLAVEWDGLLIPFGYVANLSRMQVLLHETSNQIEFIYGTMYNNSGGNVSCRVGISSSNVSGSIGNVTDITNTITYVNTGTAWESTSFPPAGPLPNLNSSADGSRRVFSWTPAGPPILPSPAILVSPSAGALQVLETATLNWESGGGMPFGYKLSFGTDDPPTNILFEADLGYVHSYEPPSGLAFSTSYHWQLIPYNVNGDAPDCPVWSFTTRQEPAVIADYPWLEDFENANFLVSGWTPLDLDGDGTCWMTDFGYNHTSGGMYAARHNFDSADQDGWLLTPPALIPASGIHVLDWWNRIGDTGLWVDYQVLANTSSDPGDPGWVELWDCSEPPSGWTNEFVDITAFAGQTVYFAFNYRGNSNNWFIDDVGIHELTIDEIPPVISHLPLLNTPRNDVSQLVVAEIADDPIWNNPIGGAVLYYSTDGLDFASAAMTLNPDTLYAAEIPAQPLGSSVSYYIQAWDGNANLATSELFSFSVAKPAWIRYDQGGNQHLGDPDSSFGAAVLFENPFYGTATPLQLLATDGSSYFQTTAMLHVYGFDGSTMTDLIMPTQVSFGYQTNEVFDLSAEEILITTPYFLVAYEDIASSNWLLFDDSYDYGTSFVKVGGELFAPEESGSWVIGAYVTNVVTELESPVVNISLDGGDIMLNWEDVTNASSYRVYGASDPHAPEPWTLLAETPLTSHTWDADVSRGFFKVIASTETPSSKASQDPSRHLGLKVPRMKLDILPRKNVPDGKDQPVN